ncbi:MAG TPA: cytochrome C [Casimicrobiaceae bacterium]|nr:cytochrome C [Casimicrobiaceae bacterium]
MSILRSILYAALFAAAAFAISHASAASKADAQSLERGRYIAKIAGCNDCHTAGYLVGAGKVAEKDWLMGDSFGWRGDWGTTYAPNLRMYMANISEDQWVKSARTLKARPPMPYFTLNEMHEADLRAFYRFVKSLGPVGTQAPAYLPPGETPKGPYAQFPSAPK